MYLVPAREDVSIERLSMTFTANGKNETFAFVFSSLNSRLKIFVFVANSRRHFSI